MSLGDVACSIGCGTGVGMMPEVVELALAARVARKAARKIFVMVLAGKYMVDGVKEKEKKKEKEKEK